jgi:hypothetical protein
VAKVQAIITKNWKPKERRCPRAFDIGTIARGNLNDLIRRILCLREIA